MTEFGQFVRQERVKRSWSLQQLAERVQCTHSFLSGIERGTKIATERFEWTVREVFKQAPVDDSMADLFPRLTKEEIELLKIWRKLPASIRRYEMHALGTFKDTDGDDVGADQEQDKAVTD